MKRFLITLLVVVLLFGATRTSFAQTDTYTVTASALNVRSVPGVQGSIIGLLYRNEQIKGEPYSAEWMIINYHGRQAYVSAKYLKQIKQTAAPTYSNSDIDLLARVINSEAGSSWHTDEHQRAVGSVVLNRVADGRFPNTIRDVVYQKGQYGCVSNGMINRTPSQRAIDNAKYLIENGVTIPTNVVWQSGGKQGNGVWKYIQGHYFCY